MLLSIVIPVRAQSALVLEAVERLAPAASRLQIIIVENGSRELRIDQLRLLGGEHDVRLIHQARGDLSSARNAGLEAATGRFVLFLDADDAVDLRVLLPVLRGPSSPTMDAVHVAMLRVRESEGGDLSHWTEGPSMNHSCGPAGTEVTTGPDFLLRELLTNRYSPVTGAYAFRRSWLLRTGLRFTPGFLHEDHAFVVLALAQASVLVDCGHVAFFKREHSASIMRSISLLDSIAGYEQATTDLRRSATESVEMDRRAQLAVGATSRRLAFILAKKQVRLARTDHDAGALALSLARLSGAAVRLLANAAVVAITLTPRCAWSTRRP